MRGGRSAWLDTGSLIAPDTARRIAGRTPGWERLFIRERAGVIEHVDRYRPSSAQRRSLIGRDLTCRCPGCTTPARKADIDHTHDYARGGRTTLSNLACLCEAHHVMKHQSGWGMRQLSGGVIEWTSPTGRTYAHEPASPRAGPTSETHPRPRARALRAARRRRVPGHHQHPGRGRAIRHPGPARRARGHQPDRRGRDRATSGRAETTDPTACRLGHRTTPQKHRPTDGSPFTIRLPIGDPLRKDECWTSPERRRARPTKRDRSSPPIRYGATTHLNGHEEGSHSAFKLQRCNSPQISPQV